MIKAIIFDFWGTLVENGVWSPIKQVKRLLNISLPFSEYVIRMERAMMTEKFSNLKEAFENVCQEFSILYNEELIDQLVGTWNKNWMLAEPYDEVKELLESLKKKYTLVLIANTDCFSVKNVLEKFSLNDLFDHIFLSYEINMIKTDKNFLKFVLDKLGLPVEEALVVGDSIQSDILAAKRLGIPTILIDRKETRDYHQKIINLRELENAIKQDLQSNLEITEVRGKR